MEKGKTTVSLFMLKKKVFAKLQRSVCSTTQATLKYTNTDKNTRDGVIKGPTPKSVVISVGVKMRRRWRNRIIIGNDWMITWIFLLDVLSFDHSHVFAYGHHFRLFSCGSA